MRVQIGPVSSGGASMWVAYARTVLAQAIAHPGQRAAGIPPAALQNFEAFLDEWDTIASRDMEFCWSTEIEAERVEYLAHTWFGIAAELSNEAEKRGFPMSPPEGEEFYQALVTAILTALEHEGRSTTEFAEQLRDEWPGLKTD